MKVLFVDDERMILSGLKRAFFRSKWTILLAESGAEALSLLAEQEVDILVSDMCMPGMNGADLLEKVCRDYPSIVRIVLSGHADNDIATKASFYAHQWFCKPCDHAQIKIELEKIYQVRQSMSDKEIENLVGKVHTLPSAPKVFYRIKQLIGEKTSNARKVARVVREDPALCTKIIQIANSSFFMFNKRVVRIEDAITRLGLDIVCGVILAAEVYSNFPGISADALQDIRTRAINVSKLAAQIVPSKFHEETILVGMLHNIGEMMLYVSKSEYLDTYLQLRIQGADNSELETNLFGVSSLQLTTYLLHLWHIPYSIIQDVILSYDVKAILELPFGTSTSIYIAKKLLSGSVIEPELTEKFNICERDLEFWLEREKFYYV